MFDTASPYWNLVWGFFILLGTSVFVLGIALMVKRIKIESPIGGKLRLNRFVNMVLKVLFAF